MKKLILLSSLFLLFFIIVGHGISSPSLADGMVVDPDPYNNSWDYADETNQQVYIGYAGGMQKMIVSIGTDTIDEDGAVWIFPLPANPERIAVDVLTSLPRLDGVNVTDSAKDNLDGMRLILSATQGYPIPLLITSLYTTRDVMYDYGISGSLGYGSETKNDNDVVVYEHLEKEGIVTEILTAQTSEGVYAYFEEKGLSISEGSVPVLDRYIGKEYSFVASWIEGVDSTYPGNNTSAFQELGCVKHYSGLPDQDEFSLSLPCYFDNSSEYPRFLETVDQVITSNGYDPSSGLSKMEYLASGSSSFTQLYYEISDDTSIVNSTWYESERDNIAYHNDDIPVIHSSESPSQSEIATSLNYYFLNIERYPDLSSLIDELTVDYPQLAQFPNPTDYLTSDPQGDVVFGKLYMRIFEDPSIINAEWIDDPQHVSANNGQMYDDRINEMNYYPSNQRGLFVTFPTDKLYFPMLPTSVYGSKIVPATIRVLGFTSPEVFTDISSFTTVEYYIDEYATDSESLRLLNPPSGSVAYTKIEVNAPSKFLTDDLWISRTGPVSAYASYAFSEFPVPVFFGFWLLFSVCASILAGFVTFKDLRWNVLTLGLLGLFNMLTLYPFCIRTFFLNTKPKLEKIDALILEAKKKGYYTRRRIAAVLWFIGIPLFLIGSLGIVVMLFSLLSSLSYSSGTMGDLYAWFTLSWIFCVWGVLPAIMLIVAGVLSIWKKEDIELLHAIKEKGYSTWSFVPKDGKKALFLVLFSFLYLLFVCGGIALIKLCLS